MNLIAGNPVPFHCDGRGPTVPCGTSLRSQCEENDPLCRVPSTNLTLPGGCETFIDGTVLIPGGAVLAIDPGAVVKGRKLSFDNTPSVLVFRQDARVNAIGTPSAPIVFTSDQAAGSRSFGDWGGIVLNGRAPTNCVPGGVCLAEGLNNVQFGGTLPNDSSGVLRYVRIEFAGVEVAPDNALDALMLNAVGRGTVLNHVQTNVAFDDCFEWFGGTVNAKHLVASGCGDDMFDWQLGYTGSVQYALGLQELNITFAGSENGLEGDNNENGFDLLPRSDPRFCNVTLVGTKAQGGTPGGAGRRGAQLRRGTAGTISNAIITGFTEAGVQLDDVSTATRACIDHATLQTSPPVLSLRNTILFDNGNVLEMNGNAASPCTSAEWLAMLAASNHVAPAMVGDPGPDPGIVPAPYPYAIPRTTQYIPPVGGPADGDPSTRCGALDPSWMDDVQYLGAFEPGAVAAGDGGNWLETPGDWISFAVH